MSRIGVGVVVGDRYQIVGLLGEGAMGVVYAARHLALGKPVALKTLHADIARDPELVARFEREARAASAIGHPNIVEVFDLGTAGDMRYIVMERLEGESLAALIGARGRLPAARAAALVLQVLAGLSAAHRAGIVHRDLKPENIFLARAGDGTEIVKLLDFGIAKALAAADPFVAGTDAAARATRMGAVLGTPLYMSPEQARGHTDIDCRTDVWAAGVVLYELLTGDVPFGGDNYNQIMVAIAAGRFASPRQRCPDVPAPLEAVVSRALQRDRDARYADAGEMREALAAALAADRDGVAVAAAPGNGVGDAALLRALDALSERAARGQLELVSADGRVPDTVQIARADGTPPPDLTPMAAAASVAPSPSAPVMSPALHHQAAAPPAPPGERAPRSASPTGDRFAPPTEAGPPLLDLAAVAPVQPAGRRAGPAPVRAPRPAVRGRIRGFALAVAVVGLLGAGGVLGYRHLVRPAMVAVDEPAPVALHLIASPADAVVRLDGEPVAATPVLIPGRTHELTATAPGRLGVAISLRAAPDAPMTVELALPHALPRLSRATLGSRPPTPGQLTEIQQRLVPQLLDPSLAELRLVNACLAELGSRTRTLDCRRPSALPADLVATCRVRLQTVREREPTARELDRAIDRYLAGLDALAKAERRTARAACDRHQRDHDLLASETDRRRAAWLALELSDLERRGGSETHLLARRFVLDAGALVRIRLAAGRRASGASEALRLQVLRGQRELVERLAAHPSDAPRGAGRLVEAGRALVSLLATPHTDADRLLAAYDQLVEAFDELVLVQGSGPASPERR